jgi:anti-sigma factor RsiW
MLVRLSHITLGGLLAVGVFGCDSKPAVVIENPPARSQTEVEVQTPVVQPPDSRRQVDVQVGGEKGVDVNVGAPPSNPPDR